MLLDTFMPTEFWLYEIVLLVDEQMVCQADG